MMTFQTKRRLSYPAQDMFDLAADVEAYPHFLPLCEALTIRQRSADEGTETLIADMTVAYKLYRETFTSRVLLDRGDQRILVEYLDGPFRRLDNEWRFRDLPGGCEVDFYIAYEFKSRALQVLVGGMFDHAFRRFLIAFEQRADIVYGQPAAGNRRGASA